MDWEEKYKKETGRDVSYTEQDEWNANRTNTVHSGRYICWLEDKLDEAYPDTGEEPELCPDPHELWAAAQLMPGEGIEDGVRRIEEIVGCTPQLEE